jgi:hypothetical protein
MKQVCSSCSSFMPAIDFEYASGSSFTTREPDEVNWVRISFRRPTRSTESRS